MAFRILICALTSLALIGCTSMRPIGAGPADLVAELEPGDHLIIYERSGRIVDMTLTEIDGDLLHGQPTGPVAAPLTVDIGDIERIEVEKVDAGKTVLAGIGTVVLILPLAVLAALASGAPLGFPGP